MDLDDDLFGANTEEQKARQQQPSSSPSSASAAASKTSSKTEQQNQSNLYMFRRLKHISDQNDKAFDTRKKGIVSGLTATSYCDLSPKGSVDEGCKPIMNLLNAHHDYVTTSSCSGRISVFHMATTTTTDSHHQKNDEDEEEHENSKKSKSSSSSMKRGVSDVATGWIFISHDPVPSSTEIVKAVGDFCAKFHIPTTTAETAAAAAATSSKANDDDSSSEKQQQHTAVSHQLTFCVEPFVMHVSCRNTHAAQTLLTAAVQAGYRNSGAVLAGSGGELAASSSSPSSSNNSNKKQQKLPSQEEQQKETSSSSSSLVEPPAKITVAIRHTASLSVPLILDATTPAESSCMCFATPQYLHALVEKANGMMRENEERIVRLEKEIVSRLSAGKNNV